jgi:hypothetical protein
MPLTQKQYDCYIEVVYLPFPSEAKRREAYEVHAELFLKAKERMLRREKEGRKQAEYNI